MDHEQKSRMERLWTPWRMQYVAGSTKESGCIFCNRLERSADVESLILHRGEHAFVIMNLYPYNTGHIMLVPNQHAADLEDLEREALHEIAELVPVLTRSLRRAFGCDGFNIGLNIGAIAGAGVAAHLHQHIVPRWQGDANFMPILASTMTIPELIPVTYAKIRAELHRELTESKELSIVLLSEDTTSVLLYEDSIPKILLKAHEPVMHGVARAVPSAIKEFALAGWAGSSGATTASRNSLALTLLGNVAEDLRDGWNMASIDDAICKSADQGVIARALQQLAPAI